MKKKLPVAVLLVALSAALPSAGQDLQEMVFLLDAARSEIGHFEPQSGEVTDWFATPVFCRPEGACGLAFSGYSLFFVDATDPERRIYEINPLDGTIWNSIPAPSNSVDGLAFDGGLLYASSFEEDQIFRLDPIAGNVLGLLEVEADLVGGLGAGEGRLFASRIRPGLIFEIDPEDGKILSEIDVPSQLPAGLAVSEGKLLVSDPEGERLLRVDPHTGALEQEWLLPGRQVAAIGSGGGLLSAPYALRVEQVAADQSVPEQVEFTLWVGLYDAQGRLLESNDHSEINFALATGEGTWLDGDRKQVEGGEVTVLLQMAVGMAGLVEVRLSGLEPVHLVPDAEKAGQAPLSADFDGDGSVSFGDFFLFADGFGGMDPLLDLDGSGSVDFEDFFLFADHFGKTAATR